MIRKEISKRIIPQGLWKACEEHERGGGSYIVENQNIPSDIYDRIQFPVICWVISPVELSEGFVDGGHYIIAAWFSSFLMALLIGYLRY